MNSSSIPSRIVVTGSSGFYGRAVIDAIRKWWPEATVRGLDVVPAPASPPDEFLQCDVTSPDVVSQITEFQPDTVIHLAFVVNPIRDDSRMHEINVGGTRNVMKAVAECQPQRFLVSSSATAYGGWPDNQVPASEDHPLRARKEYRYANDKVLVEELLAEFRDQQPEIAVSWTRPCMIYGPGLSNYLTNFIIQGPLIALPGGNNTEMQFVHLEDVANATLTILQANARGPFNVAPPDWFTLRDLAQWSGRWCVSIPFGACLTFTSVWWALRLPLFNFPSGLWYFIRYPWVVAPDRLTKELNYTFERSSRDVIRLLLADSGRLKSPPQQS
ncbi:MAG: NAD-dependent epimerase/dehydratase family protein [Planctomycetaceae bacterium]|nr:NAD-dependent epimerase/dehydratase family protein [Planctomycetaceae bacterium]